MNITAGVFQGNLLRVEQSTFKSQTSEKTETQKHSLSEPEVEIVNFSQHNAKTYSQEIFERAGQYQQAVIKDASFSKGIAEYRALQSAIKRDAIREIMGVDVYA